MKPKLLISFSGGESSAFMAQYLVNNQRDNFDMTVVYANTGEENEATLEFVEKCDKYFGLNVIWVECVTNPIHGKGVGAKVVDFETASRNGEPFEAMIAKHGIPNMNNPHCSRELKNRTINAFVREYNLKGYIAIGYRSDEMDRISDNWQKLKHVYPLIFSDMLPSTKPSINRFWNEMPFRLPIASYEDNCKVCWKKSLRILLTIAKYHPERFDNFRKWEKKYEWFIPESRTLTAAGAPFRFFRDNLTVDEILELAKQPFEEAKDDRQRYIDYKQTSLFGHELDLSFGCGGKCEVFSNQ